MIHNLWWSLLGVLLLPGLAGAWDAACGDANGLRVYLTNKDPSEITEPDCSTIPEETQAAQRDFLRTDVTIQTNGKPDQRKVRVVGGLATAKTQADRDAIDAADAAKAAEQAALDAEKATNPACNITSLEDAETRLDAIKADIQTSITAATNIATAQTAMTKMNTEFTKVHKHVVRCLFALSKTGG